MSDIDKQFPVKFFNDSDVNTVLSAQEQKILLMFKNKNSTSIYGKFYEDMSTFLSKLPSGELRKQVQNLLNKGLIFISVSKVKSDNVVSRVLITPENKLAGIILDSEQLKIDPTTGESDSVDECIYASYFGLIRATIVMNKDDVRQNKDLHKLMSTYLYLLLLKAIGVDKIYSSKTKDFIHILSVYIYYKYYLKEKHNYILSIIQRDYTSLIAKGSVEEFMPILETMQRYNSVKDLPSMLIDAKIWNENPNNLIVSLLKILKPVGFYAFIGPLDYFIGLVILSRYPVEFFGKKSLINSKIQESIEEITVEYINKIKYDLTAAPKS